MSILAICFLTRSLQFHDKGLLINTSATESGLKKILLTIADKGKKGDRLLLIISYKKGGWSGKC